MNKDFLFPFDYMIFHWISYSFLSEIFLRWRHAFVNIFDSQNVEMKKTEKLVVKNTITEKN